MRLDLVGQKFNRLVVLEDTGKRKDRKVIWKCQCDCGNIIETRTQDLLRGRSKSCGCLRRELLIGNNLAVKHGDRPRNGKVRLYQVWVGIYNRCKNPKTTGYHRYGGRGIKVCQAWQDYPTFKAFALSHGYQKGLSIDRIDNDGDYCPENCQWLTRSENSKKRWIDRAVNQ